MDNNDDEHAEADEDDKDDQEDADVDVICEELFADSRKRARSVLFDGLDDVDANKIQAKMDGYEFLARAAKSSFVDGDPRGGTLFCEAMFWGQGLAGMTPLEAVNSNRPKELKALLALEPRWVNWRAPPEYGLGNELTLLQRAFLLDHFDCVRVLVQAGAVGAIDILHKTESLLRLDIMPYMLPGCTRASLRAMEQMRLDAGKSSIGSLFLRAICEVANFSGERDIDKRRAKELTYRRNLMQWIEVSGADDFRDRRGISLEDDAFSRGDWLLYYELRRRAILTFMCIHRWSRYVNPELCRVHRHVFIEHVVPRIYSPAHCVRCERPVKCYVWCASCTDVRIPCHICLDNYYREHRDFEFSVCHDCTLHVCPKCTRRCPANVNGVCRAVFCGKCPLQACNYCVERQLRNDRMRDAQLEWDSSSASSSHSDEDDDDDNDSDNDDNDNRYGRSPSRTPSLWGVVEVDMEEAADPSEPSSPGPQFTPIPDDDPGDKEG